MAIHLNIHVNYYACSTEEKLYSRVSRKSEANASELLENLNKNRCFVTDSGYRS